MIDVWGFIGNAFRVFVTLTVIGFIGWLFKLAANRLGFRIEK